MSKRLSNFQIDDFFKEEKNQDWKNNYMGTYSIDSITKYINFYEIIKKRNAKYPFAIFNTDKENQPGVQWWSVLDINPKNNYFFYSFGIKGFILFIVDSDQDIVYELLYNFKKCKSKSGQKLELCTMKFCVGTLQKMSHKRKDQLTDTAKNFFHLLEQFAKLKKTHCMNILILLENQIQDLSSSNCGQFQLYFYKNLFNPDEKSKIVSYKTLNKGTLQTIMNEIFSTDVKENEYIVKSFKEEFNL